MKKLSLIMSSLYIILLVSLSVYSQPLNTTQAELLLQEIKQLDLLDRSIDAERTAQKILSAVELIENHDNKALACLYAGVLFQRVAKWEQAVDAFEIGISLPDVPLETYLSMLSNRAKCLEYLRNYVDSIAAYDEIIERVSIDQLKKIHDEGIQIESMLYFESIYSELLKAWQNKIKILQNTNAYEQAGDETLAFLVWFTNSHWNNEFYDSDQKYKYNNSKQFIDKAANLYLKSGKNRKAVNVFKENIDHWIVDEKSVTKYMYDQVYLDNTIEDEVKLVVLEQLIESDPENVVIPHIKRSVASIARKLNLKDVSLKYWKDLIKNRRKVHETIDNPDSIVGHSLVDITLHYLESKDYNNAKKYLDILENEYSGTDAHKISMMNDFRGWLEKIKG